MTTLDTSWDRYQKFFLANHKLGFSLDVSRMAFDDNFITTIKPKMRGAFDAMKALEAGAIANPDENRMVGHYWLRQATLAPDSLRTAIENTITQVKTFAKEIHTGKILTPAGKKFKTLLVIGIGGSALGPQFVADALGSSRDKMAVYFFDNTDPDGMQRVLDTLGAKQLAQTLVVVISKSGGTKETRNGMLVAQQAFAAAGLDFARHAVAVTGDNSELDRTAVSQKWITRFPMWDWVGGRTSVTSAVGLLPAALQGLDIQKLLDGAADMDKLTRKADLRENPAALLAAMWYSSGNGKGLRDMVILPYKDRLLLLSKYLQQLVMESIGKELDRAGQVVNQGIAVYGNKGATDQHAYVQQLRDGINNFFVTFIEVLTDDAAVGRRSAVTPATALEVEPDITCGDYLHGFFQGTRKALAESGRQSITITLEEVSPQTVGAIIALFERAVGLYAELININAYHQPGVEAGKKAAGTVIALQKKILAYLAQGGQGTCAHIAQELGLAQEVETVHHILRHLVANGRQGIQTEGRDILTRVYKKA